LTVDFRGEFDASHRTLLVPVLVRCGDDAGADQAASAVFADSVAARLRIAGSARGIHIRFRRDIASRVNACDLTPYPGSPDGTTTSRATLKLRRGHRAGCLPDRRERIVTRDDAAIVTYTPLTRAADGISGTSDAYRACLLPHGALTTVTTGYDDSDRSTQTTFTLAGTWLAWLDDEIGQHNASDTIKLLNLSDPHAKPRTIEPLIGATNSNLMLFDLAVSPVGAIAWIADDRLNALPIAGEPRPLATSAPGTLQNLTITPDGKTVAWTANGVRQSTAL